ncbi:MULTISPECIES: ABC transporter permease [Nocardioides]|uniref:ABC transporter permease n=1 Tax=Nocardioides TaxID=1839 RepID=UPI001C67F227|nr:ABC transporter permease [Nocardioides sp. CGMCC 1.13656]
MSGNVLSLGWPLAVLLSVFTIAAAAVVRSAGLGDWRAPITAAARCVVQLAAVSLVIGYVLRSMWWTVAFVGFMVLVAAGTSGRRITGSLGWRSTWMVLPILLAVSPPIALALIAGVVPVEPIAVLPTSGILVGGAMTAATLAGRRVIDELEAHRGSYDAALALGFTRRQSVGIVARGPAALALVPGQDQTRTVGLVTLPGAFVGVLLAGASPVEAGAAQAFILIALLMVQAVAAAVTIELIAAAQVRGKSALPA